MSPTDRCETRLGPWGAPRPLALSFMIAVCCVSFEACLASAQTQVEQLEREARAARLRGDLAGAEQKYLEVTRRAPQQASAYHNLGLVYFMERKYHEAVTALEKAVQINPGLAAAHTLLGRVYYELNEPEKALTALQAALRLKPADPEALLYLGKSQIQMGNYQAASATLGTLAESRPADPDMIQTLSLSYMKQMLENVNRQGKFAPHSYESSSLLALDADARKDYATAVSYYREALRAKPDAAGTHYALGMALARLAKPDEAAEEFKKELEINPNDSLALWRLGVLTLHTNPQKAREYLERAVSLNPQRPQAVHAYGRALALTGETEKAVEQFLRAVQLDPERATVHYHLAQAYRRLGRNEDSKAELARFEALSKKKSEHIQESVRKIVESNRGAQGAFDEPEADSPAQEPNHP